MPDFLWWFARFIFAVPMVLGVLFLIYLMGSMYLSLYTGQETYDCVKALC